MLFLWQKVRIDEFSRISNLSFFPSAFPVFPCVFPFCRTRNPKSLSMLKSKYFDHYF